jgi:hypothetical protein
MLLVSRMDYTISIFFLPLVLLLNIDDAISTKHVSSVKSTDEKMLITSLNKSVIFQL